MVKLFLIFLLLFTFSISTPMPCEQEISLIKEHEWKRIDKELGETIESKIKKGRKAIADAKYVDAAETFTKLIPVVKKFNNPKHIGVVYSYISLIHRLVDNSQEALLYAQEASLYLNQTDNQQLKVWGMVNLGCAHFLSKNYEVANYLLSQSIIDAEEIDDEMRFIIYAYLDLAKIKLSQDKIDEAIELLQNAVKNYNTPHKTALFNSHYELGKIYIKQGNSKEAHKHFTQAHDIAKTIPDKTFLADVYAQKARFYKDQRNYKLSSELYTKVDSLWINHINNQVSNDVQVIAYKFLNENIVKQAEINKQKVEIEKLQLKQKSIRLTAYIAILLLIISILIMINAISKKRRAQKLADLEQQVSKTNELILHNYITGQEEERKRLARDLHDGIGSQIAVLKMQLSNLKTNGTYKKIEEVAVPLCDEIYQGLRDVAFNLMPQTLVKDGLISALSELTRKIQKSSGINFSINNFGLYFRLTNEIESALFRISQEIVANIVKHSQASEASIDISVDSKYIGVSIIWNGKGFNPSLLESSNGYGWKNINTRLTRINGTIDIDSSENQNNTTILIEIPLKGHNNYAKTG